MILSDARRVPLAAGSVAALEARRLAGIQVELIGMEAK
jgi:hypothetical protein